MNPFAFHKLSYGVYVISTLDQGRPTGCTANSAMQITSEPATIAVSINHNNYTNSCIRETGKFAISILSEQSEPSIIGTFGFRTGKDVNKFDSVAFHMMEGLPVVEDSCARIVCEVIDTMETATHTVFLGRVLDAELSDGGTPMTYAYYHAVIKGRSPKNAPTYIPEDAEKQEEDARPEKAVWKCSVCGYIYDGDTPFEELPDDWKCPICKQPKSVFRKQG